MKFVALACSVLLLLTSCAQVGAPKADNVPVRVAYLQSGEERTFISLVFSSSGELLNTVDLIDNRVPKDHKNSQGFILTVIQPSPSTEKQFIGSYLARPIRMKLAYRLVPHSPEGMLLKVSGAMDYMNTTTSYMGTFQDENGGEVAKHYDVQGSCVLRKDAASAIELPNGVELNATLGGPLLME